MRLTTCIAIVTLVASLSFDAKAPEKSDAPYDSARQRGERNRDQRRPSVDGARQQSVIRRLSAGTLARFSGVSR
jgi:hypothetical protein